jgi:lysophospholipid acyltransferase (LPLAT)-like uncharacterized protein
MKIRWDDPRWRRPVLTLLRGLVRLYRRTCRCELVASPEIRRLIAAEQPVIYTSWHCHLLAPLFHAYRFREAPSAIVLMASPSRDGELIAEVARGLGFEVLYGSRRKGGAQTLRQMAGWFRRGHSGGVVADGSRGPARVAQKGVVFLARDTRAPILPLAVAARRKHTFSTWDRFELPLPFTRLAILVGEPLRVRPEDRGPALAAAREELEARLNHLFFWSQRYFGA